MGVLETTRSAAGDCHDLHDARNRLYALQGTELGREQHEELVCYACQKNVLADGIETPYYGGTGVHAGKLEVLCAACHDDPDVLSSERRDGVHHYNKLYFDMSRQYHFCICATRIPIGTPRLLHVSGYVMCTTCRGDVSGTGPCYVDVPANTKWRPRFDDVRISLVGSLCDWKRVAVDSDGGDEARGGCVIMAGGYYVQERAEDDETGYSVGMKLYTCTNEASLAYGRTLVVMRNQYPHAFLLPPGVDGSSLLAAHRDHPNTAVRSLPEFVTGTYRIRVRWEGEE
jgi:hypothetical protein